MIFLDKTIDIETEIFSFDTYYPKRYFKGDLFSAKVLEVKYGRETAINYFYEQLNLMVAPNVVITAVPPHNCKSDLSGIQKIAKKLVENNRINGINCLIRFVDTPKQAFGGGRRTVGEHLQTIKVEQPGLINCKEVLLIDDVTTTGCSLRACEYLLMQNGALRVKCVALGRTVTG